MVFISFICYLPMRTATDSILELSTGHAGLHFSACLRDPVFHWIQFFHSSVHIKLFAIDTFLSIKVSPPSLKIWKGWRAALACLHPSCMGGGTHKEREEHSATAKILHLARLLQAAYKMQSQERKVINPAAAHRFQGKGAIPPDNLSSSIGNSSSVMSLRLGMHSLSHLLHCSLGRVLTSQTLLGY